jgi:hypothetical protein
MFHKPLSAVVAAVILLAPGWSQAEPARPETIEELLVVSKAQSLIETAHQNINQTTLTQLDQALAKDGSNAEERRVYLEGFSRKLAQIMREELNWGLLKPMFMRIYSESLTQEELEGMVAFYKTPAGQAMVNKMPRVMQATMGEMQQRIGPMVEKVTAAAQETLAEAKAQHAAKAGAPQAATQSTAP